MCAFRTDGERQGDLCFTGNLQGKVSETLDERACIAAFIQNQGNFRWIKIQGS